MQVTFQVSGIRCSFVYQRTRNLEKQDQLDEKFIELASRLSAIISSDPYVISTNPNIENSNYIPPGFQISKKIDLIFRCFDKSIGGKIYREETIPIYLHFDTLFDKDFIDRSFKDQYIILEAEIYGLLDSIVKD